MFDMLDFEGREEISYDELAICISTVIGALSKVTAYLESTKHGRITIITMTKHVCFSQQVQRKTLGTCAR